MLILLMQRNQQIENYARVNRHDFLIIPTMSSFEDMRDKIDRRPPDIVFFDGGSDVSPSYYGEVNSGVSVCNPTRDAFESEVFRTLKNTQTRFAGICRGSQFLNVLFGGTLHQDIPMYHPYIHTVQNLDIPFLPETLTVNSTHHQGVKELASSLVPIFIEPRTGIIEGFRDAMDIKVRAVQSHPEYRDEKYSYSEHVLDWLFEEF